MNRMISTPVKVVDLVDTKTVRIQFQTPNAVGSFPLTVMVKSDSFVGCDLVKDVMVENFFIVSMIFLYFFFLN